METRESPFRHSEFIDFNIGRVKVEPMKLWNSLSKPIRRPDSIRLFECRVDVWQLGVATQMLRKMEAKRRSKNSIWSHAAYGLISVTLSYFEMIGKTLNEKSQKRGTASDDFNFGFCDVYREFAPQNGNYSDGVIPKVREFRDRVRNGIYHLAYTKKNLVIHHNKEISEKDFDIGPVNSSSDDFYLVDPHRMVRTIVDHFPTFTRRLRDPNPDYDVMRRKFDVFFDDFHRA